MCAGFLCFRITVGQRGEREIETWKGRMRKEKWTSERAKCITITFHLMISYLNTKTGYFECVWAVAGCAWTCWRTEAATAAESFYSELKGSEVRALSPASSRPDPSLSAQLVSYGCCVGELLASLCCCCCWCIIMWRWHGANTTPLLSGGIISAHAKRQVTHSHKENCAPLIQPKMLHRQEERYFWCSSN